MNFHSNSLQIFDVSNPASPTLTGIIATVTRWPFIHLPMRFDESYTYLQYASQPLYVTVSKYDAPNNHVLHSVLVWLATQLAGNSPEVIRCPAFVCGVLTAMVAAILRRLSHILDVFDDFEANRQAMMIWLMSLKDTLNECEHLKGYSSSNVLKVGYYSSFYFEKPTKP